MKKDKRKMLKKVPTYITGLDEILKGGLPLGRTTLVVGSPGVGKTVMGVEFIYRGAINNEPGIFFGFEEPVKTLRENALTMNWNLADLEKDKRIFLMEGRLDPDMIVSGNFSLKPMLAVISGKAKEMGAKRIVLDALDIIFALFEEPIHVRGELYMLNSWFMKLGLTALITLKQRESYLTTLFYDFFNSIADCVIQLDVKQLNQVSTRRCRIVKYRF